MNPVPAYEKMAETPQQWHLDEAGYRQLARLTWVVMEKIHGANLCFVADGKQVRCANRRQWLSASDSFFNYQAVLERLRPAIREVFRLSQQQDAHVNQVIIYGELFGGAYPHPDVPPDPNVQPVQTGVYYAPGIEFCAFDLAWVQQASSEVGSYVDYDLAMRLFAHTGVLHAAPLLIGNYTAAFDYPLGFVTTIPRQFRLPPLLDNVAEGVVIKPMQTVVITTPKGAIRPILKRKIPAFAEDRRYMQAQKWLPQPGSGYAGSLNELQWAAYQLITPNRLLNAISKVGYRSRGQPSQAQQLFRMLVEEIQQQLAEEHHAWLSTLRDDERQQLRVFIQAEVRTLLKQHFQREMRRV